MKELLVFTVTDAFAGKFNIDFYAKDVTTGETITISGMHEDSLKGMTYESSAYGSHVFKKGDKGIITYTATFLCETDIKIVPITDVAEWDANVVIESEDDRIYSVANGNKVLLYNNTLTDKTLVVDRLPLSINEFGKLIVITPVCYKIDNDVIKVRANSNNSVAAKEDRNVAAMRERANRLAGIFDK